MDTCNTVIFRFTALEVENLDFSRFLFLFGVDRPDLTGIEKLRGNLSVLVSGDYLGGDDIVTSERGRRFCRAFFARFPYWAYFFSLQDMALWRMTLALAENCFVFQFGEAWKTKIILGPGELEPIVAKQIACAVELSASAGLPESDLAVAVRKYYSDLIAAHATR